ncbi:N-6 DNA methylase [Nocardioides anomalus]|uniref:site-specific DNA-methyltransferase (adenine-specific) n=1 Tax=Nocardioides anomalus TaxID=2712223 RepID=A0A6G6WL54_9ACTN|nr:N-6 DNA methylase [Nocardioides anomalus]
MTASLSTVRVAGGLLPADVLDAVMAGGLDGLDGAAYHLGGESPREAAARVWTYLQGAYRRFRDDLAQLPDGDPAVGLTRERWLGLLLDQLGYGRVPAAHAGGLTAGDKQYPVSHLAGQTPVHLLGWGVPLDTRSPGVAGAARAPHSMVQELLNRTDDYLWAVLSNGRLVRLLRDSTTLTGFAYVEFDLEAMFDGDLYAEFTLLYLLCHQSRVEVPEGEPPTSCWLERWRTTAVSQGVRALNLLRAGVETALETLGTGFLQHPANIQLREQVAGGDVRLVDVHGALLRTVYRLLFWSVAEERGALLAETVGSEERHRYDNYFSSRRLRELALTRHGSNHDDLWQGVEFVLTALGSREGEPRLGLPGLGGLFTVTEADVLDGCRLPNTAVLSAMRSLSVVQPKGQPRRRVDFAQLGAEELGSIYESLLELVPRYDRISHAFSLEVLAGNDRKTSGSYYTPTELVELVLDTALDPVLDDVEKRTNTPEERAAALLDLKVCDPAVGSAHFLVAAARRIAMRLATARTGELDPTPTHFSDALHDVVARCLYGVDVNPMAADLAKVSLWLTAMTPGRPLSFLDHHIKVGNALLGTTPALLKEGIPNTAFAVLTGDDKDTVAAWKKANNEDRKHRGQADLFGDAGIVLDTTATRRVVAEVANRLARTETVDDIAWAAQRYHALRDDPDTIRNQLVADAWCAAFLGPKGPDDVPLTDRVLQQIAHATASEEVLAAVRKVAQRHRLFHWHLEFPEIFPEEAGHAGFDAVVGNPPFLSPLRAGAAVSRPRLLAKHAFGGLGGPKADESSYFLLLAARLRSDRGRIGLVLPDSFLAATDSADIRRSVAASHDLALIWRGDGSEFEASVTTIIVVLTRLGDSPTTRRLSGPDFAPLRSASLEWRDGSWAPLIAGHVGGLYVQSRPGAGTLGDLCDITADYRDQYYGLRGAVFDAPETFVPTPGLPYLVTTGLIDPLRMSWGNVATKFDKARYERPVVDLAKLAPPLRTWAEGRLRPKLLVATQGKLPEVAIDEHGEWLPCVPVISVVPREGGPSLRELAALLTSPPIYDFLRATKLGAGLATGALKVSAGDLRQVPAPADLSVLAEAAVALEAAFERREHVQRYVDLMNKAFRLEEQASSSWNEAFHAYLSRRAA